LISAALFLCVGVLYDRLHSRLISDYGGVVNILPKFSLIFIIFVLGGLGLPGTSGFIGEFLVLVGAFKKNYLVAILSSTGVVLGAAYMLWLAKRVIFGDITNSAITKLKDLNYSETFILSILVFTSIFFGFYPDPLFSTMNLSVNNLINNYQMDLVYHLSSK
jgi:NADH-quinone oxidoreductase subunit M